LAFHQQRLPTVDGLANCGTASVAAEVVVIRAVDGSEVSVLMSRRESGREWEEKVATKGTIDLGREGTRGQAGK
jgi:hypothetical protein